MYSTLRFLGLAAALAAFPISLARAQTIPDDGDFEPVLCNGLGSADATSDTDEADGARDIVGAPLAPAYFFAYDDEFVYLRMRVNTDSLIDPEFRPFGWGFAFDTDGDLRTFEALVILDDGEDEVRLHANTSTGTAGNPADAPDTPAAFTYEASTHAEITSTISLFGLNFDFFVTVAVPWDDLDAVGVESGNRTIWAGTSFDGQRLNGDIACHNANSGTPRIDEIDVDPVRLGTFVLIESPAEGAVVSDLTPAITGTTEPGNTVTISVDGGTAVNVTVEGDGSWSYTTPTLAAGEHEVEVFATDEDGMTADDDVTFEVDPGDIDECAAATDTCDDDAICTNTNEPPGYTCECEPGFVGDGEVCEADSDGDGVTDEDEQQAGEDNGVPDDLDGDGLDNWEDPDADGDGIDDGDEPGDSNGDGVPDYLDPDTMGPPPGATDGPGLSGGALCGVAAPGAARTAFPLLAMLGLAIGLVVRRRRALRRALAALALAAGGLGGTAVASAQVTLDAFRPTETADDGFAVRSSSVLEHLVLEGQVMADYANDPLVYELELGDPDSETARVVAHELVGSAVISLGLFDRLMVFAGGSLVLLMKGDDASGLTGVAPADGFGLGDVFAGGRLRLVGGGRDGFGLALQAAMTAPLSRIDDDQAYRGEDTVTFLPSLVADYRSGPLRVAFNVGARVRANETIAGNTTIGDELNYGLGIIYGLVPDTFDLHVEAHGKTSIQDFFDREASPFEVLAGARYHDASGFTGGVAAGPGLVRGFGAPDVRLIATLGYRGSLARDEAPAQEEEEEPEPAQERVDTDRDGIFDDLDRCPTDPEDRDEFRDEDGCPDRDNDEDLVLDVDDGAPNDPEDRDGFEDTDGVPDPDNDGDTILDAEDRCPLEPGVAEFQGCPNPDRDGDTVPNVTDNCPDEPGPPRNNGCRERQRVVIEQDRIRILDAVYFATGSDVILRRSFRLLDNVASVLAQHPEIARVRVEGHTDSRGEHDYNVQLSQRRAESVVRYLVTKGIAAERLEARGFGPDRPVVPNARRASEHAQNRRVEFNIVRDGAEAPAAPAPESTPAPAP